MDDLRVTLLGTGSPIPDPDRAGPSSLVRSATTSVLVDAGRGVLMRLAGAGVAAATLDAVLLTHLHSDHLCDLNDVITTAWVTSMTPRELHVYGPPRTSEVVDGMVAMLAPDISYRLAHHEDLSAAPNVIVHELEPGDSFEVGDLLVLVGRTDHRPVEPTVGYRVELAGRSIVLGGDGIPCDSLDELCREADVYVQTVVRDDLIRDVPLQRFVDILDYHSSVADAARTAARAGARKLVLTHQVPAVQPGAEAEWRELAREHFDGEVVVGDDGLTVEAA